MIILYDTNNQPMYPLEVDPDSYVITHKASGLDLLSFDLPVNHEHLPHLGEEIRVEAEGNLYVIKSLDDSGDGVSVDCELDLDAWKTEIRKTFTTESGEGDTKTDTPITLAQVLEQITPTGWSCSTSGLNSSQTASFKLENVTNYDILSKAMKEYDDVGYRFDTKVTAGGKDKTLSVFSTNNKEPSAVYVTDELNLESLKFSGDSTDLVTRLYAYGKDGLTMAGASGGSDGQTYGLEYVEDTSYTKQIICGVMKDTSIEDANELKAAAEKKLKELAYPKRSYQCSVVDLAKLNPEYSFLTFQMYQVVTLIDRTRNTTVNHQVVEYKEYPLKPEKNVVTLSTTAPRIETSIGNIQNSIQEQQDYTNNELQNAIQHATDLITGVDGGVIKIRFQKGKPAELLILKDDTDSWETTPMWRWNANGLGYSQEGLNGNYELAMTMDGQINANYITSGVLKSSVEIPNPNYKNDPDKEPEYIPNLMFDLNQGQLMAPGLTVYSPNDSTIGFSGDGEKYITFNSNSGNAVFIYFNSRNNSSRIGNYGEGNEGSIYIESGMAGQTMQPGKIIFRGINSTPTSNADANVEIYGSLNVNGVNITRAVQALVEIQAQQRNLTSEQQAKLSAITEELEQAERKRSQQEYPES
ncbi:phage tail spike protein [Clostridium facile]|uniref:Phage tail protein n=1 Tax=Clostridium facile TaxID=2763035 RepID=A0ABR7IP59_9CLOT|nr:phage tail spike protein [Clostridium facile]MBC5786916.1 phage tail protein [Clostridium facile]